MTTVIKGGTVVTHDLTYKADVLTEGGIITAIGPDLAGDTVIDAEGAASWRSWCWLTHRMPLAVPPSRHWPCDRCGAPTG